MEYPQNVFLISTQNMLWYSLEAPLRGVSNEYHKIFLWRNKENISSFFFYKSTLCGAMFYIQY